ncbi:hypothetical protein LINPERHAP2_LOCUS34833 [Linum perenne]
MEPTHHPSSTFSFLLHGTYSSTFLHHGSYPSDLEKKIGKLNLNHQSSQILVKSPSPFFLPFPKIEKPPPISPSYNQASQSTVHKPPPTDTRRLSALYRRRTIRRILFQLYYGKVRNLWREECD